MAGLKPAAMSQPSGRWQLGLLYSMCTVLMWGLLPLAVQPLLHSSDPVTVSWFRFLASGLLLLLILSGRGMLRFKVSTDRKLLSLLLVAILGLVANYILYVTSLEYVSPAVAAVVIQIAPVLLTLGSLWVFGEQFSGLQWAGFLVLVAGIALFCQQRIAIAEAGSGTFITGVFMVLAAAASWTVYGLAQKRLLFYAHSQTVMLIIYAAGSLLMWPMSDPASLLALDNMERGLLIFLALNTLIAYGCFAEALNHWPASKVGAALALVPVVTLIASRLLSSWQAEYFPAEQLGPALLLGAAMVVFGSGICAMGPRSRSPD